jgi:hypothetical protein
MHRPHGLDAISTHSTLHKQLCNDIRLVSWQRLPPHKLKVQTSPSRTLQPLEVSGHDQRNTYVQASQPFMARTACHPYTLLAGIPQHCSVFILFAIFFAFPIVWAFILSFQRWDGIGTPRWVGLDNYAFMLRDPETHQVLYNTLILLALILPFGIMLPVFLAVLLNLPLKLRGLFRVLVFVPSVTPVVLVAIVFRFISAVTTAG